jgi:hypothetical protein
MLDLGRTVPDDSGRVWDVVSYRGDDVATRKSWARSAAEGRPVVLVLTRAVGDDSILDASSIADLASRAEGPMIDVSVLGYFRSIFPKVNPPLAALVQHRHAFVEHVEDIARAYPRFRDRWGEPDSWTRGQFLAVLLLARYPAWSLDDLWCSEDSATGFAAHAIGLLCHPDVSADDLPRLAEVIWESSRYPRSHEGLSWLTVPDADLDVLRDELSAYLVLGDLDSAHPTPHFDTLVRVKLPVTSFDPGRVGPMASSIRTHLKDSGRWGAVQRRSESVLTLGRLANVADLLPVSSDAIARVIGSPSLARPIGAFLIRRALVERFRRSSPGWPSWIPGIVSQPIVQRLAHGETLSPEERTYAALAAAAAELCWVEDAIVQGPAEFAAAEELLDWYVGNGRHLLEYRVAEAFARIETVDDPELHEAGHEFVMKGPESLRHRVRRYLDALDRRLADFVRQNPSAFLAGKRSALRIIPELLRTGGRMRNRRVWVLVMDGMRYDTWDAVIRPLVTEHFEVVSGIDRAYFSLLPSKTDIARRGLLAAALGKDWKNYKGYTTKDERILAARALGVAGHEVDAKVTFVTDAETTQARAKLGFNPEEARDVNVLIYPISDDLGHYHNDTLAALNEKVRSQLVSQQGMRGIIDDLRRRVQADDLVVVTSDHGFQELFPEDAVTIPAAKLYQTGRTEEDVAYRYLKCAPGKDWGVGEHVIVPWEEHPGGKKQVTQFCLPVGATWYQREKGKPARYAHGGISLAEMVIPGVLLRPIAQKAARVEYLDLPAELVVAEDESGTLSFEIVNSGNVTSDFELTLRTNLSETLVERKGRLAPGKQEVVACTVRGIYRTDLNREPVPEKSLTTITAVLGHTDHANKMQWPKYGRQLVRVTVKPKPAKIDTDALKAFDAL